MLGYLYFKHLWGVQDFLTLLGESFRLLSTSSIFSPQRLGCHFYLPKAYDISDGTQTEFLKWQIDQK